MTYAKVERKIGGQTLKIETGRYAKQADGAVMISYGETVLLVTAQSANAREGLDFFPLTVEYRERMTAAGKFPGGFIKREGRPSMREILTCRLTDRPIRPLFPEGYKQDVQVIGQLLSADRENDPDVLMVTGASAALAVSSMPFGGPVAAVRVGLIGDEFVLNPTTAQRAESVLDLVVAGTETAVVMVEAGAKEVEEEVFVEAIEFAHDGIREILPMIVELAKKAGKAKVKFVPPEIDKDLHERVRKGFGAALKKALKTKGKLERYEAIDALKKEAIASELDGIDDLDERKAIEKEAKKAFSDLSWKSERALIIDTGKRVDGRLTDEIRDIWVDTSVLPRTHGSAVFTRGETQALVVTTLGTGDDEQRVENVHEDYRKRFYLDYTFPPFSVGEVRPIRGVGRREIGHGALAERAVQPVLPDPEKFSYTIRITSDILESNGSSSMATVCGATLSMMDAGVPLVAPVAGIAMGLVMDGKKFKILSDIAGSEDHNGDMDFKVAGTAQGITALQMDIKVGGLTLDILRDALEQARKGRQHILDCMLDALSEPRENLSPHAPRLQRVKIPVEKIGLLIGPGGRQIKAIQESTGSDISVNDEGIVLVSAPDEASVVKAMAMVRAVTAEVEVGQIFDGKVVSIKDFGAFVEIAPGQEGLCHVSELSDTFVDDVSAVVSLGDMLRVKVIFVDPTGRIKLSRKAAIQDEGGGSAPPADGAAAPAASSAPDDSRGRDRGRPPRRDRDDRGPRGDRDDRPPRRDRDDRPPRRDRDDRPPRRDRDDRPPRGGDDYAPRAAAEDRGPRETDDRPPRRDRDDRPPRRDRDDRGPRRDRDDRPPGRDRDDRGPRGDRDDRPPSRDRDDRGPRRDRDDRGPRDDRPPRRDRDDSPRSSAPREDRAPGRGGDHRDGATRSTGSRRAEGFDEPAPRSDRDRSSRPRFEESDNGDSRRGRDADASRGGAPRDDRGERVREGGGRPPRRSSRRPSRGEG